MMKGHEKSSDRLSPKVNALLIIDVQEKIIRAIFKKDSITKNIKKANRCLPNFRRKHFFI